jgi:hypothetical protein
MGIPLPAATQWDLVKNAAKTLSPVHVEFVRQAAQGTVLHNDDTTMIILKLTPQQRVCSEGEHVLATRGRRNSRRSHWEPEAPSRSDLSAIRFKSVRRRHHLGRA